MATRLLTFLHLFSPRVPTVRCFLFSSCVEMNSYKAWVGSECRQLTSVKFSHQWWIHGQQYACGVVYFNWRSTMKKRRKGNWSLNRHIGQEGERSLLMAMSTAGRGPQRIQYGARGHVENSWNFVSRPPPLHGIPVGQVSRLYLLKTRYRIELFLRQRRASIWITPICGWAECFYRSDGFDGIFWWWLIILL
jgi:hypothetical protein